MPKIIFIFMLCAFYSITAFSQWADVTEKDGKYGLFDKNHGVIIDPVCEKIISKSEWGKQIFILKKGNKYAYAYFRNLDSLGKFGYLTPHWEISTFVFDELVPISSMAAFRYKKNEKYGLIFVRTHFSCDNSIFRICYIDGLGEVNSSEAIYDEPFWFNNDKILHVKKNNQYQLFQPLESEDLGWINYTFNDWFDTIPLKIESDVREYEPLFRIVKKDSKWGVVKINPVIKELEYIVPCDCDKVLDSWDYNDPNSPKKNFIFLCQKTAQQKAVIYYDTANPVDVPNINKPVYHFFIFYTDTIPNEKEEMHKKYVHITLGSYDIQSKIFSNKEQCIFDMQSGATTFYIDDDSTAYEIFLGYHGIIIEKQTKTANGITYEYIDHETNSLKLTLKSNKKNISYRTSHTSRHGSTNDYLVIEMIKEKEGSKSYLDNDYSYKYYYDFRKKKFFIGKCKGCQ